LTGLSGVSIEAWFGPTAVLQNLVSAGKEDDVIHALGRSGGGYSTKLHVVADGRGTLLAVTAKGGQRHESAEFENLFDHCELSIHFYRDRPEAIAGDKGYSSNAIRDSIRNALLTRSFPLAQTKPPTNALMTFIVAGATSSKDSSDGSKNHDASQHDTIN
jgi:hypothetical protein